VAKNADILFWALGAILLVGGGAAVYTMTRGLRNNNPGNIRYSADPSQQWEGLANPPFDDKGFAVFVSSEYGIRAIAHTLNTYASKYGLTTVTDIITRWAPPTENDTAAYIAAVAGALSVDPAAPLDMSDPNTIDALIGAIITHEDGLDPYSAATIETGRGLV
jgi:hypothetical protein